MKKIGKCKYWCMYAQKGVIAVEPCKRVVRFLKYNESNNFYLEGHGREYKELVFIAANKSFLLM